VSPLHRELLIKLAPHLAGTAAGGLVGALLMAAIAAPCIALASLAASSWRGESAWNGLGRRVAVGMLLTILLKLAAEFAGDEVAYWHSRGLALLLLVLVAAALVALPIAWLRGRGRRPRAETARRLAPPARPAPGVARPVPGALRPRRQARPTAATPRLIAASILLGSTAAAALLKQRVHPEHLAWSAAEALGLALVAAPFAWLLGRFASQWRRGMGTLVLAATVALSGWLSLAERPLIIRQTSAAMQELASLMSDLPGEKPVKLRAYDRWRYGQCAPIVQGMSRYYGKLQSAIAMLDRLEPVVTDESFADALSIRAAETRLVALRGRLDEVDADIESSARELRREIENADISPQMRRKLLDGVNEGLAAGGKARVGDLLRPLVGVLSRLIGFMKERVGRYEAQDSGYVFDLGSDADAFNELLDELEEEKERLRALSDTKLQNSRKNTERFKEWSEDPFNRPRPSQGQ
jgi:hypothetical protein